MTPKSLFRNYEKRASLLNAGCFATGIVCAFLSGCLLTLNTLPYASTLRIARLVTGTRDPFRLEVYHALQARMVIAGIFYGAVGIMLFGFRRRFFRYPAIQHEFGGTYFRYYWGRIGGMLRNETRLHVITLSLITLMGALLRLCYLNEPPRYDEAATYLAFASRSLIHVLAFYPDPGNHILQTALMWASCHIFGNAPWAFRVPVFLAGTLLIPLSYATARRFAGRNAGLCSAGLVAVSNPVILYSVNGRGYMIQAIFVVLLAYLAAELADGTPGSSWILFSGVAAAGFWTVPTMLYGYLVVVGWLIWNTGLRLIRPLVFSGVATILTVIFLYMPVIVVSGLRALLANPWVAPLSRTEFLTEARVFPTNFVLFLHAGDPAWLPFSLGLLVALGFVLHLRSTHFRVPLLLVLLIVLIIVPAMQRVVPFPRILVPLLVIYYITAARGWALLDKILRLDDFTTAFVFLALVGYLCFHFIRSGYMESHSYFPDSRAVAHFLSEDLRPCDVLVISLSAGAPLEYELRRAGVPERYYFQPIEAPGRVLIATSRMDGPLPGRGNGLLRPALLTVDGSLELAHIDRSKFTPPQLIYASGRGQVFELKPLRYADSACAIAATGLSQHKR